MENPGKPDTVFAKSERYSKTSLELLKLKAIDKSSSVISTLVYTIIMLLFFTLFFIVFNIGLSFLIGELLGKIWLGFFIVGGAYLVIGLVSHFFLHNIILRLLVNTILSHDI